jgi:1,4-dihydroxy-2-naphthoate octaprenyltransferase
MASPPPSYMQTLRAPFFSSILAPLIAGTLLAVGVTGNFSLVGFVLVLVTGLGLHGATNVYNDIYDTLQGTDRVNDHRNEFSGGSGILVRRPELMPVMIRLARVCLGVAFAASLGLSFVVPIHLISQLWTLYVLSAFFAKYYTAAPFKLAYRGLGEISVCFAFGPMAILMASISQGLGAAPEVFLLMAPTGLSTLSILWIGQMIDLHADVQGGKRGMVARIGTSASRYGYVLVQALMVTNLVLVPLLSAHFSWWVALPLLPYTLLLPKILAAVFEHHGNPHELKAAAKLNVLLHLLFSLSFAVGLGLNLM